MRLLLNGGGSGEQTVKAVSKLNEIIDHTKPILYVPLAMDEVEHPYDGCYEWVKKELSLVQVPGIDMVRTKEELGAKDYDDYSAIFIGGGNTYKLLKDLKESGAFLKIQNYIMNDGIVFGSSAGAVIFGANINSISCMDPNMVELTDTKGFDVLNGMSIFPHYTNTEFKYSLEQNEERHNKFTKAITEFSMTVGPIIAYPEEDTIYIDGDNISLIGTKPYYIVENGIISKIEIDEEKYLNKYK